MTICQCLAHRARRIHRGDLLRGETSGRGARKLDIENLNEIGTLTLQYGHDGRIKSVGRHFHTVRAADGDDHTCRIGKGGERDEHGDGDESGGWPSEPVHGDAHQRNYQQKHQRRAADWCWLSEWAGGHGPRWQLREHHAA